MKHTEFKANLLSIAIRHSLLAVTVLGTGINSVSVFANTMTVQNVQISAGSLAQVVNQFAEQIGILLTYDAQLLESKQSTGLKGSYNVESGFNTLLSQHGLELQKTATGYTITARPQSQQQTRDVGQLKKIDVTAITSKNSNTTQLPVITVNAENKNSYTIKNTSTATGLNLSLKETPQSITVVTRQRMDDQNLASITDVLKQTPGVTMSQDGGERFNIYSRGSAIDTYQFDGVTTTQENQTRNMPSTLLDMALYEQVEIVRGATGLMTGAGEPSGVINLIRKKPTHEFKSYVQASAGSWDNYRGEVDVSGPFTQTGTVRGRLVVATQDNKSFMDIYSQKRDLLYGIVEADITDSTRIRFGIDYQKYKSNGAPGIPLLFTNGQQTYFSRSTSSGANWMYDNFATKNYTGVLEQKLGENWNLKINANYMDVDRDSDLGWYRSTSGFSYLNQETGAASAERAKLSVHQTQKGLNLNLQGKYDLFNQSHDLAIGYSYSDYENNHNSLSGGITTFDFYTWNYQLDRPSSYIPSLIFDIQTRQSGYYIANRFNFTDKLHLIAGARISDYKYDSSLTSLIAKTNTKVKMRKNGKVTPYAGIVYDITPNQSIYTSYTDIFKPQSSQDRNGNILDPVVGKNYELGWKGEFYDGRLNASAALFKVERENYAEIDTGFTVPGTTSNAYKAVDGAETKGIDFEISGEILPRWNANIGYSHARTEDASGTRLTTQLPMDTFQLWNTYQFSGQWDKFTIGGGVNWNSSKSLTFSRYNATVKNGDYTVVNLMAHYKLNENLSTTFNLNNLFDEKYYAGMAGSYGHYGAPRNFMASVKYNF